MSQSVEKIQQNAPTKRVSPKHGQLAWFHENSQPAAASQVQLDGRHLAGCRFAYHQVKLSALHISNHRLYLVHRLEVTGSDRSNLHNLIPDGNALKRGMRVTYN